MIMAGTSGSVTITNNKSDGSTERFIRIGDASKVNLTITNNTITNYKGADDNYIKVTGEPMSKTITGNTASAAADRTGTGALYIDVNDTKIEQ